ncbi:exo-alpha-sialidase [uncultured Chitinophaga sp.]|uniref:sialidase family protein n=1 Tax=uncultured Chitinophaga sp. TaxID=339340 RepID=UPI0025E188D9|nr:sialidase family protein [uncultured Chitinophaga sp.]
MKRLTIFLFLCMALFACNENEERIFPKLEPPGSVLSYVFQQGGDGYSCFRIPAIIMTKSGTLLAFAEGRKDGCGDEGDIDLVMKRSTDTGRTWSKLSVVWSDAVNTCGNPVPVVDRVTGKIALLMTWNKGDDAIGTINAGTSKDTRRIYLTSSTNDGVSWETVKEITTDVKKPGWGWYATGPCHGIQMLAGGNAGRMIAPCDYIEVGAGRRGNSHVIYSDDAGATWKLGGVVPQVAGINPNESTVAELPGGKLLLNMRVGANENLRMSSTSEDGGITWSVPYNEVQMIDPVCQGSLLSATIAGTHRVFFSNPAATTRKNMTIKMSTDQGVKWDKKNIVFEGPAGYSDLVQLSDTHVGLLYEAGVAKYTNGIAFKSVAIVNIK